MPDKHIEQVQQVYTESIVHMDLFPFHVTVAGAYKYHFLCLLFAVYAVYMVQASLVATCASN